MKNKKLKEAIKDLRENYEVTEEIENNQKRNRREYGTQN